jgi:hypothetical protein
VFLVCIEETIIELQYHSHGPRARTRCRESEKSLASIQIMVTVYALELLGVRSVLWGY